MDILSKINWVDVLILIIILRTSYVAFQDGLSHEIFPLVGSVCMLALALHYYNTIAVFLNEHALNLPMTLLRLGSFIAIAVCIGIVFGFIKAFIDKVIKVSWHPVIEKFGGRFAGIFRGMILASTILIIMTLTQLPYLRQSVEDKSYAGAYFLNIGPAIYAKVSAFLPAVKVGDFTAKPEEPAKDAMPEKRALQNKEKRPAAKK